MLDQHVLVDVVNGGDVLDVERGRQRLRVDEPSEKVASEVASVLAIVPKFGEGDEVWVGGVAHHRTASEEVNLWKG